MSKKGGKGKKKGYPEGTPLEDYETTEMNLKDLKKYAVKMGAVLKDARIERCNLEIDRDKMLRNLVNVVCRQMLMNREIRRIDRELINKEQIFERKIAQRRNDLAEVRFKQIPQLYRSKNELFLGTYQAQKKLFLKQDQMFKDRIGLNSDYYKKYLELEGTFMAAKHNSLCDKMDKINESHISQMLWTEQRYYRRQQQMDEGKYDEAAKGMKLIVDEKESVINNIQKEHVFQSVDILRSFENITKYNFTVLNELSKELSKIKYSDLKVIKKYKQLQVDYDMYCNLVNESKKEVMAIEPVIDYLHHVKTAASVYSEKLKMTDEEATNARLEVDMLENFLKKDDDCTKKLKQVVISDLMSFRQLQVKAHLFLMNLGTKTDDMYHDRVQLGKMAICPKQLDLKLVQDLYQRYACYRRSMIDIVERVLRSSFSNLSSLGFHLERPPTLPKMEEYVRGLAGSRQKKVEPPAFPGEQPVGSRYSKAAQPLPKLYHIIKTMPRVPIKATIDHLLPNVIVKKANVYSGSTIL